MLTLHPSQFINKIKLNLLVKKGLKLGQNVFLPIDTYIDTDFPWLISIGDNCTISRNVIILSHDASMNRELKHVVIGRVTIGRGVFIGAGTIILPNVSIGENAVVGAGSVVRNDIPSNCVAVGCPAKPIKKTEDFLAEHLKKIVTHPIFLHKKYSLEEKRAMWQALENGVTAYSVPRKYQKKQPSNRKSN
jgi:maltose O-acetyltransferase